MGPTLEGFTEFLYGPVGIPVSALPIDSTIITNSYTYATKIVLTAINTVCPEAYTIAIYNLATDYIVNWAQDQTDQIYFTNLRKSFGINSFVAGVISSTSDESTSETLAVPDWVKGLTLGNLQRLKTPYGRVYLSIAQEYGTLWGLS